jgi:hypothetical protein
MGNYYWCHSGRLHPVAGAECGWLSKMAMEFWRLWDFRAPSWQSRHSIAMRREPSLDDFRPTPEPFPQIQTDRPDVVQDIIN